MFGRKPKPLPTQEQLETEAKFNAQSGKYYFITDEMLVCASNGYNKPIAELTWTEVLWAGRRVCDIEYNKLARKHNLPLKDLEELSNSDEGKNNA